MNKTQETLIRVLFPLLIGIILYALVYILHYFEDMDAGWLGVFIMLIPVLIIFEIDRGITKHFQKRTEQPKGFLQTILIPFLISFSLAFCFVLAIYIPAKLYEIHQGADDTLGSFHIISMFAQVFFISLVANAFHQLTFLVQKWKEEAIRTSQLEKENIKAKLSTLRSQISPHFLFNNFNTLYGLIETQPQQAKAYLMKLSELYRRILAKKNEELLSLEEEIETLHAYLFLLNVRFPDDIITEIDIDNPIGHYYLPPITLQMLVENAIKHNSFDEDNPLHIKITQHGESLRVLNNRTEKKGETPSHGIGLENIRNRYALLSDQNIEVEESAVEFSVKVPLLQIAYE